MNRPNFHRKPDDPSRPTGPSDPREAVTSANQGFTNAFANEHEPELAVTINSAKVTPAQLAKTRRLNGVTATAGPYPETTRSRSPAPRVSRS